MTAFSGAQSLTMKESLQKGVFDSWLHSDDFANEFRRKLKYRRNKHRRRLSSGHPQPLKPLPDPFPSTSPAPSSADDEAEGGDDYSSSSIVSLTNSNSTGNGTIEDGQYVHKDSNSTLMMGAIVAMGALILLPLGFVCMVPSLFFPKVGRTIRTHLTPITIS